MAVTVDQSSIQMDIFKPEQVVPDVQIVWNHVGDRGADFFLRDQPQASMEFDSRAMSNSSWVPEIRLPVGK
jgi:hypothetical protein